MVTTYTYTVVNGKKQGGNYKQSTPSPQKAAKKAISKGRLGQKEIHMRLKGTDQIYRYKVKVVKNPKNMVKKVKLGNNWVEMGRYNITLKPM